MLKFTIYFSSKVFSQWYQSTFFAPKNSVELRSMWGILEKLQKKEFEGTKNSWFVLLLYLDALARTLCCSQFWSFFWRWKRHFGTTVSEKAAGYWFLWFLYLFFQVRFFSYGPDRCQVISETVLHLISYPKQPVFLEYSEFLRVTHTYTQFS